MSLWKFEGRDRSVLSAAEERESDVKMTRPNGIRERIQSLKLEKGIGIDN